ncbi:hypothetical protein N658DRAFT_498212 [Parathielavia hyrcaniae]|uniref:Fungal N-terminal domain-containing protein n=1 Tax=Parathielavia hyrcaniae TaxID=113614 RepID=A0AAN6T0G7_9PEZI|nr:hypothetical protein N658DRAFT_498212 [Parathielavia hyrcaniae]
MAEAIAAVGVLAAVVQLSSSAHKLAVALYDFARDAGAAAAEVEVFANQVESFSGTIQAAQGVLYSHFAQNRKSPIVQFLQTRNVYSNLDTEATMVRRRLVRIRDQVTDMAGRSILWNSIKWTFKKSSITVLSPQMESVKASLILLMVTAQLEAINLSHSRDDEIMRDTIRSLRRAIRHNLRTLKRLHQQLSLAPTIDGAEPRESVLLRDALVDLAWGLYEHGVAPGGHRTSSPASDGTLEQQGPPPSRPEGPQPSQNTNTARRSSAPPRSIPPPPDTAHHNASRPLSSSPPASTSSAPSKPPLDAVQVQVVIKPHQQARTLRYRETEFDESISGYAGSPRWSHGRGVPPRHTTALLVRTLDGNIISQRKARELDLDIEPLEPNDWAVFDFGTGKLEQSVGKAVLEWHLRLVLSENDPGSRPLTVTCYVCENSTVDLVVGKPFVEAVAGQKGIRTWSICKGAA